MFNILFTTYIIEFITKVTLLPFLFKIPYLDIIKYLIHTDKTMSKFVEVEKLFYGCVYVIVNQ